MGGVTRIGTPDMLTRFVEMRFFVRLSFKYSHYHMAQGGKTNLVLERDVLRLIGWNREKMDTYIV